MEKNNLKNNYVGTHNLQVFAFINNTIQSNLNKYSIFIITCTESKRILI